MNGSSADDDDRAAAERQARLGTLDRLMPTTFDACFNPRHDEREDDFTDRLFATGAEEKDELTLTGRQARMSSRKSHSEEALPESASEERVPRRETEAAMDRLHHLEKLSSGPVETSGLEDHQIALQDHQTQSDELAIIMHQKNWKIERFVRAARARTRRPAQEKDSKFVRYLQEQEVVTVADFVNLSDESVASLRTHDCLQANGASLVLLDAMNALRSKCRESNHAVNRGVKRADSMVAVHHKPFEPRKLFLKTAKILKISNIEYLEQKFTAEVFMQFRFPDGANDAALSAPGDKFPFGEDGKLTFLPPAGWYLDQFDLNNGMSTESEKFTWIDKSVSTEGKDIILNLRLDGTFHEEFELHNFPFDIQSLQVCIAINCRTTGAIPVHFYVDDDADKGVELEGFQLAHEWHMAMTKDGKEGELYTVPYKFGAGDRQFPSMRITATVKRKPTFYVINVMVPIMLLTSLSFMQYAHPHDEPGDRTEITLNMVLALVGFKFVVSQMTPAISYFTILDKYTFFCVLLTIFVAFEGGLVGELKRHPKTVDRICMYSTFGVFVIGHVFFAIVMLRPSLSKDNNNNTPPGADFRTTRDVKADLKAGKFDEKREVEWTK